MKEVLQEILSQEAKSRDVRNKVIIVWMSFLMILVLVAVILSAYNYQPVDLNYNFNYAVIRLQNGEVIEGKVESWRDYEDGEQIQVKINGVLYLTNSFNCTLMNDPNKA
jgi:uncharacterized membrane protein YvbJ